ncbi:MAG: hypothetical protein B6245_03190 [Desulfobacteraceae bacterium 4572_88]|nr:MAG: hypothetical protein B6245_03190 [Desulfobacteraceae bacterium 4572_88]
MKYVKNIMIVLMIGLFVSGTAFAADKTGGLTVEAASGGLGDTVSMGITLDDDEGAVAGLAFTLTYDSTALIFAGLEAVDVQPLANPEGLSDSDVETGTLYYQYNDVTAGEVLIAAASASAVADGTVLKVKFTVADDAEAKDYDIGIKKSTISNAAAGYNTPTEIDPLVGLPEGDEFKESDLNDGKLTVSAYPKGDASGNGVIDSEDALYILYYEANIITADQLLGDCDLNNDDVVDSTDALYILYYEANIITSFDD